MENNVYKIVKIIDEYTVVINAGSNSNVQVGDEFQILDKQSSEVIDPDTDEVIGYLDLIKATVKVSEVQEKMCICTSKYYAKAHETLLTNIGSIKSNLSFAEQERLNIDYKQATGGLRRSDEPIRIGDTVNLVKTSK